MGGSSSKSDVDIFMESVNDVFVQSIQSCSMNSNVEQIINIKGDGNILSNIELNQVYTSLLTCVQDVNMIAQIQNNIEEKIKSFAESQSVALLGALGNSDSEINTRIHNSVRNAINVTTMTQLVNNVKAAQTINLDGSGNTLLNINMKQVNNNIASSSQQVIANIDVLNTMKATLDQKSKATQEDPIENLLNGLSKLMTGPIMWVAIIIIGGLIVMVIFLNTGAGSAVMNAVQDQYSYEQPPVTEQPPLPMPINQPPPVTEQPPLPMPINQPPPVTEPISSMNELMQLPKGLPKLEETSPMPISQSQPINETLPMPINQPPPVNKPISSMNELMQLPKGLPKLEETLPMPISQPPPVTEQPPLPINQSQSIAPSFNLPEPSPLSISPKK